MLDTKVKIGENEVITRKNGDMFYFYEVYKDGVLLGSANCDSESDPGKYCLRVFKGKSAEYISIFTDDYNRNLLFEVEFDVDEIEAEVQRTRAEILITIINVINTNIKSEIKREGEIYRPRFTNFLYCGISRCYKYLWFQKNTPWLKEILESDENCGADNLEIVKRTMGEYEEVLPDKSEVMAEKTKELIQNPACNIISNAVFQYKDLYVECVCNIDILKRKKPV